MATKLEVISALSETDGVAVRCVKAGVAFPDEWKTYVAALRALINPNIDLLSDVGQALPTKPAYPAGT